MTRTGFFIAVALMLALTGRMAAQLPYVVVGTVPDDTLHWYTGAPIEIPVIIGPIEAEFDVSSNATIVPAEPANSRYIVKLLNPVEGVQQVCVKSELDEMVVTGCLSVVIERPEMVGGIDRWRAFRATVGRKYNPSSEWYSLYIPAAHYQTIVEIDGREVFNRYGNRFRDSDLPDDLMVTPHMKDVRTTVYWKPNGTPDIARWVALATTGTQTSAMIPLGRRKFEINYPAPEQADGFEFNWTLTPKNTSVDFGPIVLQQGIGGDKYVGVQASAVCQECEEFGITPRLIQTDDRKWMLSMQFDQRQLPTAAINGKRFDVMLQLKGRGDAQGFGAVDVTIRYDRTQWGDTLNVVDSDKRGVISDARPEELIKSLKPFQGMDVAIFSIEGELRGSLIRPMEAEDRKDIEAVEAICRQLYDEPLGDCLNTLLKLTSSARTNYGKDYPALKLAIAQQYVIDPDDLNDADMQKMISIIQSVKARRDARPNIFYLVTSTEKQPRVIGIVTANGGSFFDGFTIREVISGSTLQRELAKLGPTFTRELSRVLPSAMVNQVADLQMIWPVQ